MTQVRTVDRARLTEQIGALSPVRLQQVLSGLALVFGWDFADNE
ncbi:MAG TPA: type II toxin-antitoxin system PemK/MazF family toxin [Vicinamibacteria bacterium]|nr:type II toxin-antitoxin system PemK/MazF family toxin [Vicinamibacteria bacterium]